MLTLISILTTPSSERKHWKRAILMLMMLFVMIMSMISILMLTMRVIRMQGVRRETLERSQVLLPVSVGYGGGAGRVAKREK